MIKILLSIILPVIITTPQMDSVLVPSDFSFFSFCESKRQFFMNTHCHMTLERGVLLGETFYQTRELTPELKESATHLELLTPFSDRFSPLSVFALGKLEGFTNLEFLIYTGDVAELDFDSLPKLQILMTGRRSLLSSGLLNLPDNLQTLVIRGAYIIEETRLGNLPQGLKNLVFLSMCHYINEEEVSKVSELLGRIYPPEGCVVQILFGDRSVKI